MTQNYLTADTSANAASFPYHFSTKPQDPTTGLYYYGYRWYSTLDGRWPSRDPMQENGGLNLYGVLGNNCLGRWDYLGLISKGVIDGFWDAIHAYANPTTTSDVYDAGPDLIEKLKSARIKTGRLKGYYGPHLIGNRALNLATKLKCNSNGVVKVNENGLVDVGDLVLGRVGITVEGEREWKCEPCQSPPWYLFFAGCSCKCKMKDKITVSFSDIYDFEAHPSDSFIGQSADYWDGAIADILDGSAKGTSFTINGSYTVTYNLEESSNDGCR